MKVTETGVAPGKGMITNPVVFVGRIEGEGHGIERGAAAINDKVTPVPVVIEDEAVTVTLFDVVMLKQGVTPQPASVRFCAFARKLIWNDLFTIGDEAEGKLKF